MPIVEHPRLFDGFSPLRFLLKAFGLYIFFLGAGTAFAEWSNRVKAIRDFVSADGQMVFIGLGVWIAFFGVCEFVRLRVKYDLAMARIENRKRRRERRAKR